MQDCEMGNFLRDAKVVDRFDPARPDFSPYGFSCVRWTATAMPRCDRHNEIELNLLESGRLVYPRSAHCSLSRL